MKIPNPLPEGTLVILKSGGPLMTTEKMRLDLLVPAIWFSADGIAHRDVFHIDAVAIIGMPCRPPDADERNELEIVKEVRQANEDILNASRE